MVDELVDLLPHPRRFAFQPQVIQDQELGIRGFGLLSPPRLLFGLWMIVKGRAQFFQPVGHHSKSDGVAQGAGDLPDADCNVCLAIPRRAPTHYAPTFIENIFDGFGVALDKAGQCCGREQPPIQVLKGGFYKTRGKLRCLKAAVSLENAAADSRAVVLDSFARAVTNWAVSLNQMAIE